MVSEPVTEQIGTGKKVSEPVLEKFGTEKVSEPVSEKFGTGTDLRWQNLGI